MGRNIGRLPIDPDDNRLGRSQRGQRHIPDQSFLPPRGPQKNQWHVPDQSFWTPGSQGYMPPSEAAIDYSSLLIEVPDKGKALFSVQENSDTGCFFAGNLKGEEAVKRIEELTKNTLSLVVKDRKSDTVYYVTEDLSPQAAIKLVTDIKQGKIDLKELRRWLEELKEVKEVERRLNKFSNRVGELFKETIISVVSGISSGYLITLFGPLGAIGIALGVAAAERAIQNKNSVGPSLLGGVLGSSFGPMGAILIPLGGETAVKLLSDKKSHE